MPASGLAKAKVAGSNSVFRSNPRPGFREDEPCSGRVNALWLGPTAVAAFARSCRAQKRRS